MTLPKDKSFRSLDKIYTETTNNTGKVEIQELGFLYFAVVDY